jgi:hypothetical protein
MFKYKIGIEFEYLLLGNNGQILDFTNINSTELITIINESRVNHQSSELNSGDLGIKDGFWYLEGDERFDEKGNFVDLKIKGIEIRTPVCTSVNSAVSTLLKLETELSEYINKFGYNLSIAGFNPITAKYEFLPKLNLWEKQMREKYKEYDYAQISNLSYGPDINLSSLNWSEQDSLEIAKKLNYYSPFMVPFSFSSPFYSGKTWRGLSKRTYERTWRRPAVKLYTSKKPTSPLEWQTKNSSEVGRIEYKAFDAILSGSLLRALCSLVLGVALSNLPGRSENPSKKMHQTSAVLGFQDNEILEGSTLVIKEVKNALKKHNLLLELEQLKYLEKMLSLKKTGSDYLINNYNLTGKVLKPGGLSTKDKFILF